MEWAYSAAACVILPALFILDFGPSSIRYYVKLGFYYLCLNIVALASIPIAMLRPARVENMVLCARAMQWVSSALGISFDVKNRNLLHSDRGPFVIVVNHQHSIDVLFLLEIWPEIERATTLAKRALLYFGPFGLAAYLNGTTFIDRGRGAESRKVLEATIIKAKENKTNVIIFPEGTRHHSTKEREMLPFKKGAFAAAIGSQMPVLPVVISHYKILDTVRGRLDRGKVEVTVLDPVSTEGMSLAKDLDTLTQDVRKRMLKVFQQDS